MNRSILIVICDFLLVSLIAFSNFDSLEEKSVPQQKLDKTPEAKEPPRTEVVSALKTALEDERASRERLMAELANARQSMEAQQSTLSEREARLRETETQARQLQEQRAALQEQRTALQQQINTSQKDAQALRNALAATESGARLTAEQVQALRNDLRKKQEESEQVRSKLAELERSHSNALSAKQQLAAQVAVVEAEKRLTTEQLAAMKSEVQTVRAEKAQLQANTAKLAAGVSNLAQNSTALVQEIRENRPIAANTLFNEFNQNRVRADFETVRSGIFGREVHKAKETETIFVTDGTQTVALCHVADTPLTFWPAATEWESLNGYLSKPPFSVKMTRIGFHSQDPRVVLIPVDAAQVKTLGSKVYKLSKEPFKFGDAVLVGAREAYYGECKFQIDLTTPQYVKMDRSFVKGLFGKFNPSQGDIVLSKTGEVMGIMVNKDYCVVLNKITAGASLFCGDALRVQETPKMFDDFQRRVLSMPMKLQ